MRTPSADQYSWVLDSMTPGEREALEELINDIVDRENTGNIPGELRTLAAEFVRRGLSYQPAERQGAMDIAAGLYERASRYLN